MDGQYLIIFDIDGDHKEIKRQLKPLQIIDVERFQKAEGNRNSIFYLENDRQIKNASEASPAVREESKEDLDSYQFG